MLTVGGEKSETKSQGERRGGAGQGSWKGWEGH